MGILIVSEPRTEDTRDRLGRMMASAADSPDERAAARRHLERACDEFGAMPCWMYAHHLEEGQLGDHDPATVRALMKRACETGYDEACGHESASETFD